MSLLAAKNRMVYWAEPDTHSATPATPWCQLKQEEDEVAGPATKAGNRGRDGGRHATRSLDDESPREGRLGRPGGSLVLEGALNAREGGLGVNGIPSI